jgi:hypothetical protein
MAKLTRERRLMERRLDKKAKKEARKQSSADHLVQASESTPDGTDQAAGTTVEPRANEV